MGPILVTQYLGMKMAILDLSWLAYFLSYGAFASWLKMPISQELSKLALCSLRQKKGLSTRIPQVILDLF